MNNHSPDCIFCQISQGKIPSEKTFDDDNFFAILDNKPKTQGHTLIIPKKHYKTILDMPASMGNELLDAIKKVSFELIKKHKAEGINIAVNTGQAAGQIVHHAHVHILPRKKGDNVHTIV